MTEDHKTNESTKASFYDVVREGFMQTLGRITVSREAAEAAVQRTVNRLVELGKMTQDEAKNLTNEIKGRIDKNRVDLERRIDEGVTSAMAAVRFPKREDVDALKQRVTQLEKLISDLEHRPTKH